MLRVHAFFHLNLMFSSIEKESRETIVKRCYWPILNLAERLDKPIGIEATSYTLEEIERLDPAWIHACRKLIERGLIELVGSGYAQVIGPLFPAPLTEWNLKLGHQTYEHLFGRRPRIALVNEQAYSAGLLPLYAEAGYEAILMDWDMCAHAHPDWPDEWRYHAQRAQGQGAELPVIWTNTVAFQKLQRLAHGDIEESEYIDYVLSHIGYGERTLALYSGDAEAFDFRPGRYKTEAAAANESEWDRIFSAFARLVENHRIDWISTKEALIPHAPAHAGNPLRLESAAFPVPVKKQMKYNVSRWAVTGRADYELNRRCRALVRRLHAAGTDDCDLWRKLCWLCSSDFRTHITEKRFAECLERLAQLEDATSRLTAPVARKSGHQPQPPIQVSETERSIEISSSSIELRLNKRKGLAIDRLRFKQHAGPIVGTIPHGAYDDLVHSFDWFSGTLIAEFVGEPRVTDLPPVDPTVSEAEGRNRITIESRRDSAIGEYWKLLELDGDSPSVTVRYILPWSSTSIGTLRVANMTLLPDAIDPETLFFETHNGGRHPERFALKGTSFDHGAPVSFLVSASSGVGMTEGSIVIGDARAAIRISATEESDAFLGLVTHRVVKDKVFCRVALSVAELDETRKPWGCGPRPLRLGYTISPA